MFRRRTLDRPGRGGDATRMSSTTFEADCQAGQGRKSVPVVEPRELLLWAAQDYWQRGWRPFPLRLTLDSEGKKVPNFPKGFGWTELRDRAFTWEETLGLFDRPIVPSGAYTGSPEDPWKGEANALAIVLEPGHLVIDTDTEEATDVVGGCVLPEGPRARTSRGWHYHFQVAEGLADASKKPGAGLEFLCRQIVFMPPSAGYSWESLPDSKPAELPSALAMMLRLAQGGGKIEEPSASGKKRQAKPARGEDATQIAGLEVAPWADALGTMRQERARWRALCPLHPDNKTASFTVFRGERGGLQGHCFGCGWSGSLRMLHRELRRGDTTLYRRAADAIVSLGEELEADTRGMLLAMMNELQRRRCDPRQHFSFSVREVARLTGCEPLDFPENGPLHDGKPEPVLRWRGKAVYRLFGKLRAAGVKISAGARRSPSRSGRKTQFLLPEAWFVPTAHSREDTSGEKGRPTFVTSSSVGNLEGKQAKGQTASFPTTCKSDQREAVGVPVRAFGREGDQDAGTAAEAAVARLVESFFPGAEFDSP